MSDTTRGGDVDWVAGSVPQAETRGGLSPDDWKTFHTYGGDVGEDVGGGSGDGVAEGVGDGNGGDDADAGGDRDSVVQPEGD